MKNAWTLALWLALPATGFAASARSGPRIVHARPVRSAAVPAGVFSGGRMATGISRSPAARSFLSNSPVTYSRQMSASRNSAGMNRLSGFSRRDAPPSDQTPPPWATTVGALIRTEGLGFKEEPAGASSLHSVEAGDRIAMEDGKSYYLTNRPGLFNGPKDTPPPPSPGPGGSGGASGRNAITPNAPSGGSN